LTATPSTDQAADQLDQKPDPTTGTEPFRSNRPKPAFEIIAGSTAPGYVLASNDLYAELATNRRCRFLITDGKLSVDTGRELKPTDLMRVVGSEWHATYAKRMVLVPASPQMDAVVAAARSRYSLANNAQCFLSVPHDIDRAIYDAQREYLGEHWDVNFTTRIDFSGSRPSVTGLINTNQ
jgi:hypothetical protein